jgi:cysteinyl-tRNA synthetase
MLQVLNTLTREVEPVVPAGARAVRMYSCGPTVYRDAHIGNFRTFLLPDLLRRAIEAGGVEVRQVQNITDVGHLTDERMDQGEDRMLVSARLEGRTPPEIAAHYTEAFLADAAALGIRPAHAHPRATTYVPQMIALTERLLAAGNAYETGGNVYFSVASFPAYGRLSGNTLDQLRAGHRGAVDPRKRHHADFTLWRAAGPGRIMKWPSPWGDGFPGWHIECSAMVLNELGERVDVHTGGVDLVFPHHEDEIAQSEAAVGHQVVRVWAHGEHLLAEGRKMAKSTGNVYTVRDVAARGADPLALRLLFLQARYRAQFNFTWDALDGADRALARLRARVADLDRDPSAPDPAAAATHDRAFRAAIDDDLDTPRALTALYALIADETVPAATRSAVLRGWDATLGLDLHRAAGARLPPGAEELIARRAEARAGRDFAAADALRDQLAAMGVDVLDTSMGTTWQVRS